MSQTITRRTTIRRRRSIMGFFLLFFCLAVNAAFAYAFFSGLWHWLTGTPFADGHPLATAKSEFTTLIAWAVAAAITYALAWLTRGRRDYVEVEEVREEKPRAR
jgi:hypothetical protein